jgi:hypothetical protein
VGPLIRKFLIPAGLLNDCVVKFFLSTQFKMGTGVRLWMIFFHAMPCYGGQISLFNRPCLKAKIRQAIVVEGCEKSEPFKDSPLLEDFLSEQ